MTSMSIMHQSTSVKQGGAFNLQVASTYSNETKELLKGDIIIFSIFGI